MQTGYEAIQAEGAEIIAISADTPTTVGITRRALQITYPLLSDEAKSAITAYNVLDPGNEQIARPATYLIDESGIIRWKFLDVQLGKRLSSAEIVAELQKL
ncbi:hypothetical protein C6495_06095 [Candidatus Poribacteria bacterium]|nr:MAG: hypothetical protein C6495_06095 [Candidatus Poribacteria bacterium]